MIANIIKYFLNNKLITGLLLLVLIAWGIINAPFNWKLGFLPRDPVPVDAIPDIGENQQIVYAEWPGRSPQDIEDQITYPLTTALLGIPGVKTIRSNSIFGLSSIYIIFDDNVDFYWSRTRILEKLNSLPSGTLPDGVTPSLGPDATALGQVYWYTLEGRDTKGNPAGGWDPQELRTIQDYYVRYSLESAKGVSEVASIGGYVKEYQVDVDPDAMKAYGVNIAEVMQAVRKSNLDIGARTLEFNRAEYLIRALGYIKSLKDLEESVVAVHNNVPVRIGDVAKVNFGPATRRGGLDKGGAEAVGGVVVARYGANPMEVIQNVKKKIAEISAGLPGKKLSDGTISKVTIVPFYDRSGLIKETLGTLQSALTDEILISILVVIILVMNLRASILISSLLPVGVLMTFIIMRRFHIDANIVALSGIAIAIGVMVDVGIIFTENIVRHLDMPENKGVYGKGLLNVIYAATVEVASAVITALATTIVSFLPVFAMQAAEGKLFKPLAFTKSFALLASLVIGIMVIPSLAQLVFSIRFDKRRFARIWNIALIALGIFFLFHTWLSLVLIGFGVNNMLETKWPAKRKKAVNMINIAMAGLVVVYFLSVHWMPLGAQHSVFVNMLFVLTILVAVLGVLLTVVHYYSTLLKWCLAHKWQFLIIPVIVVFFGILIWQGANKVFGFVPLKLRENTAWQAMVKTFPGIGQEFMPSLDEGSFLLMPSSMPHSGVQENIDDIRLLDMSVNSIPEVESVVGKWGRVNSALDPAPVSMYECIVNYKPEYILDENGHRLRFKIDKDNYYILNTQAIKNEINGNTVEIGENKVTADSIRSVLFNYEKGNFFINAGSKTYEVSDSVHIPLFQYISGHFNKFLIPGQHGVYFRNWRPFIKSPSDIWKEIVKHSDIPGLTSAPKLQPIQTRLIMLQTGMRAPMGIKVFGPDLQTIEKTGLELEKLLKEVPGIEPASVFADRVVGKPYLEIKIDRQAISRYGLTIDDMQKYIGGAIGGMTLTTAVEGRERFPVRMRYAREFRDNPGDLKNVLIPTPVGVNIPLAELASITYTRGPQLIKSENTFLVGYVIFDKKPGFAEGDVVENAQAFLNKEISSGHLVLPAGVNYKFTGDYENQVRASRRLMIVVPVSLLIIFLILYFQFNSVSTSGIVFSGIFVAFAGGFLMIWLYGQPWFMNFSMAGVNLRDLFHMHTINLSVAVWVGFIALFGIATNDGVIMGTYQMQVFEKEKPGTVASVREAVLHAGIKRVRPAMMTASCAIIALIPVLTSTGKGADIMTPMAIPLFGGMVLQVMTMFVVPVLYCAWKENKISKPNS